MGPQGPKGDPGTAGKWTKIAKVNWSYGKSFPGSLTTDGLKIVFDQDICFDDITDQTVMLLFPTFSKATNSATWAQALATDISATAPHSGTVLGNSVTLCKEVTLKYSQTSFSQLDPPPATAARTPATTTWQPPAANDVAVRVAVKGDLIRDLNGAGVDADDLPACWASGQPSGDLVEGGTFESWFYYHKG